MVPRTSDHDALANYQVHLKSNACEQLLLKDGKIGRRTALSWGLRGLLVGGVVGVGLDFGEPDNKAGTGECTRSPGFRPPSASAATSSRPRRSLAQAMAVVLRTRDEAARLKKDLDAGKGVDDIRSQVKYLIVTLQLRKAIDDAAELLPPAEYLSSAKLSIEDQSSSALLYFGKLQTPKDALLFHGSEAFQYLSQIIEFDSFDELKKTETPMTALKKDKAAGKSVSDFWSRALGAAVRELDQVISIVPVDTISQSQAIVDVYFQ